MLGVSRRLTQHLLFTQFLIQRDCLTASFTRMGSGFTPPTVITEAKEHLLLINQLMKQMEEMAKDAPQPSCRPLPVS